MREPKWKNPRAYPWEDPETKERTNPDPIEFALSIFNEVTGRKHHKEDGKWVLIENGNEVRDYIRNEDGEHVLDTKGKRIEAFPGFVRARPKIVKRLSALADGKARHVGVLELFTSRRRLQIPFDGLAAEPVKGGGWIFRKSLVNVYQSTHRQVALAGLVLLDLPIHDSRRKLLRRCDACERFFFHSENRRNVNGHWCSTVCKRTINRNTYGR